MPCNKTFSLPILGNSWFPIHARLIHTRCDRVAWAELPNHQRALRRESNVLEKNFRLFNHEESSVPNSYVSYSVLFGQDVIRVDWAELSKHKLALRRQYENNTRIQHRHQNIEKRRTAAIGYSTTMYHGKHQIQVADIPTRRCCG